MKQAFGVKPVKSSMHSKCWTAGNHKSERPIIDSGAKGRLSLNDSQLTKAVSRRLFSLADERMSGIGHLPSFRGLAMDALSAGFESLPA
jgi:hypothetical protein